MNEPHDNDAERALLGAILCDRAIIPSVLALLRSADFFAPAHGRIWEAIASLTAEGQPVDHLTLSERLKARGQLEGVGGPAYLMQLDSQVPVAENARQYAEIIRDRAARRKLLGIGRRLMEVAVDMEQRPDEVQGKAAHALATVDSGTYKLRTLSEILDGVFASLNRIEDGKEEPVIPTGIKALDNVIAGAQATLIVVGARTGVGKSAFGATLTQNVAKYFAARGKGERVGVFSLEDEGEWLAYRILAAASGVSGFVLRYRKKTDAQWASIGETSGKFRHYADEVLIDDRPNLTSWELSQAADDMVVNHGVRLLLVDHLQEVDHWAHKRETLEQNMTCSLRDLRAISKRHGIPVVLLCQMREDDKVKPGDFQGAGGFFGARETVKKSRVALELAREPQSDVMKIRVLKQTNGLGQRDVEVKFVNGAAMIADIEGQQAQLPLGPEESL